MILIEGHRLNQASVPWRLCCEATKRRPPPIPLPARRRRQRARGLKLLRLESLSREATRLVLSARSCCLTVCMRRYDANCTLMRSGAKQQSHTLVISRFGCSLAGLLCWSGNREGERRRKVWRRFSDKSCRKATACGL